MGTSEDPDRALRNEWILLAVTGGLVVALLVAECICFPREALRQQATPLGLAATVVTAFAHAAWISLDRRRRGREVGGGGSGPSSWGRSRSPST